MIEEIVQKLTNKLEGQYKLIQEICLPDTGINEGVAPRFKHTCVNGFDVYYEDEAHVYFYQSAGKRYPMISVTTLIHLFQSFDEQATALRCARKPKYEANCLDTTSWETLGEEERAARILKAWDENSRIATEYGTAAHMACEYYAVYLEQYTTDAILCEVRKRCGEEVTNRGPVRSFVDNMRPIIQNYLANGFTAVPEPLLVDMILGTAGQSDLVMINHQTRKIHVLDYKTNKSKPGTDHAFDKMKGYFEDFDDTAWVHYCIQLTYYSMMLQAQYPGYEVECLCLLWLNKETGQVEPLYIDFTYWAPVVEGMRSMFLEGDICKKVYSSFV